MEIVTPKPSQADLPSYSIEALLIKAGVHGQQKVSSKVESLVRVKGTVSKISRYPHATYVTLRDRDFNMTLKCDNQQQVFENTQIIAEGSLLIKPSNFYSGLECYIDGNIVGSWEVTNKPVGSLQPLPKKSRFTNLHDLLEETDVKSLLILGTEIGINDVLSQLPGAAATNLSTAIIRVGRPDSLVEDMKAAGLHNYEAFAMVRGGDDNSMELWNDPNIVSLLLSYSRPFYTALGHSHSRTLADQYADTAYHTPSSFGIALNSILSKNRKFKDIETEYLRLKQEYIVLAQSPQTTIHHATVPKTDWMKAIAFLSIYTIVLFILFASLTFKK